MKTTASPSPKMYNANELQHGTMYQVVETPCENDSGNIVIYIDGNIYTLVAKHSTPFTKWGKYTEEYTFTEYNGTVTLYSK